MEEKEYTIDILEVVDILKENCKPILRITGCVVALSVVYCILAVLLFPKYESEAVLQIRQEKRGGGLAAMIAGFGGDFLSTDSQELGNYVGIAKSRSVVIPVIEATEEPNFFGKYPRYETYVEKRITMAPIKGSDLLQIKVTAKTEEKAQRVNQMLIQGFLKKLAELNSLEKSSLKNFLEDRLKTSREDLDKAETALQQYKVEHKIITPDSNAEIFTQRIVEAEKQAAVNQIELEAAKARVFAINSQLSGSGSAIADNQMIQKYNAELAQLETTRIVYKEKYTAKHPKMIDLEDRISQLKGKIKEEKAKVAALQAPSDNAVHQGLVAKKYSSEGALAVLQQKAEALQNEVDKNNAELEKLPEVERGYIRLARDYKVASEIYMMLTKKLEETKVTEFQAPNNVQIVDEPTLPDKLASPRVALTILLAAFLGFLLSSVYVVLKELVYRKIRGIEDVKQFLELPVLAIIPDEVVLAEATISVETPKKSGWKDKLKEFIWKE